jgi:hypothetical protein
MRGRWWWRGWMCMGCVREARVQTICRNAMNVHLQLNLADKGGGAETALKRHERSPPARSCMRGRWWWRRRLCAGCVRGRHMPKLLVSRQKKEVAKRRRAIISSPPHVPCRSPLVFSTHSQPTNPSRDPSTSVLSGLHPSLEGRGQVATSLGVNEPKRNDKG